MTEVIAEYENAVDAPDGSVWAARACGRPLDGKWEAWIEFIPLTEGHSPVRTPPETTQVDRDETQRWAKGNIDDMISKARWSARSSGHLSS